jgi:hypothetical protein
MSKKHIHDLAAKVPAARHETKERLIWLAQVADEGTIRRKVEAALSMRRLAREVMEGEFPAGSLMMQHGAAHAHRACMAVAVKTLNVARLAERFGRVISPRPRSSPGWCWPGRTPRAGTSSEPCARSWANWAWQDCSFPSKLTQNLNKITEDLDWTPQIRF